MPGFKISHIAGRLDVLRGATGNLVFFDRSATSSADQVQMPENIRAF
ncbi:hypothetical protein [Rhizobium lusitanum]|jgi:hypothetical protein|nr:hypothetical protein [Rhizobium lusitanum]NTJ06669.1 hypothetical protein [Rhizobium lusitanum]